MDAHLVSKLAHVYVIKLKESKTYKYGITNNPLDRAIRICTYYDNVPLDVSCDYDNSFITCLMSRKAAYGLENELGKTILRGREFWPKHLGLSAHNSSPTEWFPKSELSKAKYFLQKKGFTLTSFSSYQVDRVKVWTEEEKYTIMGYMEFLNSL